MGEPSLEGSESLAEDPLESGVRERLRKGNDDLFIPLRLLERFLTGTGPLMEDGVERLPAEIFGLSAKALSQLLLQESLRWLDMIFVFGRNLCVQRPLSV